MRLFVLVLAIAMVTTCHATDITKLLEKFKETLRNGDSKLGIPVLDPLKEDHVDVDIHREGLVEMKGTLDDVDGIGLSDYQPLYGDIMPIGLKVKVSLLWKEIKLSTKYDLKGMIDKDVQVYGKGDISAVIQNLNVSVSLNIKNNSTTKRLTVANLALQVYIDTLDLKVTGLYDDEEMSETLSKVLSEIVPGLLRDYQAEITAQANLIVTDVLNGVLKNITMADLIGMITGG